MSAPRRPPLSPQHSAALSMQHSVHLCRRYICLSALHMRLVIASLLPSHHHLTVCNATTCHRMSLTVTYVFRSTLVATRHTLIHHSANSTHTNTVTKTRYRCHFITHLLFVSAAVVALCLKLACRSFPTAQCRNHCRCVAVRITRRA